MRCARVGWSPAAAPLSLPNATHALPPPKVENGTLATVLPPEPTYNLQLRTERPEIVDEGKLSALQLEFVTYACMRHEATLPTGETAGFFLGDGAGMGKGRQLAGLILENWLAGRKRHIWVSTSRDLWIDAQVRFGSVRFGRLRLLTSNDRAGCAS